MTRKHLWLRPVGWLPILVLLQVVMAAAPAKAQTIIDWISPGGGDYNEPLNWTGFNVPNTISETAQFDAAATYDVTLASGTATFVSDLLVGKGDVTFDADSLASATYETDDDAEIIGGDLTLSQAPFLGDVILNIGDLLKVRDGSTLRVLQGSSVTAANLDLGTGGDGTMIVDGDGSSLIVSTTTDLGSAGDIGTLTFQNFSTGNSLSGSVDLAAFSSIEGTTGRLNVLGGSTLQTGSIDVGRSNSATLVQEGTLTVDGTGSSLTQTGSSTFTVGDDVNPNVVSDVIISNSGVMSSGTGTILIQNSGHLNVSSGTFNANGNVNVDGGTITSGNNSNAFNLGSGRTLTATSGAQIHFGGVYDIDNGTTINIQSGDLSAPFFRIGGAGGNGTLVVDGAAGSSVIATASGFNSWGTDGNTADVTIRNGAFGNLGGIGLADSAIPGTTGTLRVQSDADVTTETLTLATHGGIFTTGTITVDGAGSTLTQLGASELIVGHASTGTATLNLLNEGTFNTGTGTTTVNATGTINIDDTAIFIANGDIDLDGGTIIVGDSPNFNDRFLLASGLTLTAKNVNGG